MSSAARRWRVVPCVLTITACLPYLVLKALWLLGSSVGSADAIGRAELDDTRHVVGNLVTAGMELVAVVLVLALTCPWGRRLPQVVLLAPVWFAGGLLAPIAIAVPVGILVQAAIGGSTAPAGNGLHGWVYAAIYGGFLVQAAGLLVAFLGYVHDRRHGASRLPSPAAVSPRRLTAGGLAAAIAGGYAALNIVWALTGTRLGGPAGFDTAAQKTLLVATGALVGSGAFAAVALLAWDRRGPLLVALAWVGTAVTTVSGPVEIALANHARVSGLLVLAAVLGAAAGLVMTATLYAPRTAGKVTPTRPTHGSTAGADQQSVTDRQQRRDEPFVVAHRPA